jgi:nitroreductase
MIYSRPISEVIRQRYSCRTYEDRPIEEGKRQALAEYASSLQRGPLGTPARFTLLSASEQDRSALRGLGTYGFIRGATGFIVGAVGVGEKDMEDFGYLLEQIVLFATSLDLGTCWLGGTFTKSNFARRLRLRRGETMPAVAAVGHIAGRPRQFDRVIRRGAQAERRLPWEQLFFEGWWGAPLSPDTAGAYAVPLEMVRLGPSATNKQPWRIVRDGTAWHFFLQRTPRYSRSVRLFMHADLQRVDMGIAMSHFALSATELALPGRWAVQEPPLARPDRLTEYVVSWVGSP